MADTFNSNDFHLTMFDPGGAATGWAHFIIDFRAFSRPEHKLLRWLKFWDCGEFTGPEHAIIDQAVAHVQNTLSVHGYNASYLTYDVVSEDFDLTQIIGGKNLLSPVRINAVLDWECRKLGLRMKYQARQMRTSVTRERLKLFGFEGKFRKDEFAAMQHAIVYARRLKDESRARPWKLSEGSILNAYYDCNCADGGLCDLIHPS